MKTAKTIWHERDLSPTQRRLVELVRRVQFGYLRQLVVAHGQPSFTPAPLLVRCHKLGSSSNSRTAPLAPDMLLKQQWVELLEFMQASQHGVIELLEIKEGLPYLMSVTERIA